MQKIKDSLSEDNKELKSNNRPHKWPLSHGYKPDLYMTDECDSEHEYLSQQLIGILQWEVQLGSIGIQI